MGTRWGCLLYTSPFRGEDAGLLLDARAHHAPVSYTHLDVYKRQVVDRLIAGAPVTRPSLGIIVRRGQGENGGLVVEEVDPDSDCHRQGIQPQDIIVAANGQQVQTFADLERIKRTLDVGDSLLLEVLRGRCV